jgi:hypothetical protein
VLLYTSVMQPRFVLITIGVALCFALLANAQSEWVVGAGKYDITGPAYGRTCISLVFLLNIFSQVPFVGFPWSVMMNRPVKSANRHVKQLRRTELSLCTFLPFIILVASLSITFPHVSSWKTFFTNIFGLYNAL